MRSHRTFFGFSKICRPPAICLYLRTFGPRSFSIRYIRRVRCSSTTVLICSILACACFLALLCLFPHVRAIGVGAMDDRSGKPLLRCGPPLVAVEESTLYHLKRPRRPPLRDQQLTVATVSLSHSVEHLNKVPHHAKTSLSRRLCRPRGRSSSVTAVRP